MTSHTNKNRNAGYLVVFIIFTLLCWSPFGYGSYGEVGTIMGMPSWAFLLLLIGTIMFVIQWFYLFVSDLALYDEDLDGIIETLKTVDMEEK